MDEHTFSRSVLAKLKGKVSYQWKVNANFADGIPDIFIEGDHRDMWIEVKYAKKLPKQAPIRLDNANQWLSALQQDWIARRNRIRGDAFVLFGYHHTGKNYGVFTQDYLSPLSVDELIANKQVAKDLAAFIISYVNLP